MQTQTIKPLEVDFVKRKFDYHQIKRSEKAAIYQQTDEDGTVVSYETISIRISPPHPNSVTTFDKVELYPSDEQFGVSGWSFATFGDLSSALQLAQQKFEQITLTHNGN